MKINAARVREERKARQWSQEQLADACGLNLRTIQRLEASGNASSESLRALAAVFELEASALLLPDATTPVGMREACVRALRQFDDFKGTASREEYWWFFLAVLVVAAPAAAIHERLGNVVILVAALPLLAVGARRLHDTGRSGWWQLFFLAPFGFVVPLWLLSVAGTEAATAEAAPTPDSPPLSQPPEP